MVTPNDNLEVVKIKENKDNKIRIAEHKQRMLLNEYIKESSTYQNWSSYEND